MAQAQIQGRSPRLPGLSTPPTTFTMQLDSMKKRSHDLEEGGGVTPVTAYNATNHNSQDVDIAETDDTPANTASEPTSLDKSQEDSVDPPVRAQGGRFDMTNFYGDFTSLEKKYISQVYEKPIRNFPSRSQAPSTSEVVARKYKYSERPKNPMTMSSKGTAHSDNGHITWEAFQIQKEQLEREAKQLEHARIAQENELLFLGDTNHGDEVKSEQALPTNETDLLEFSPLITPTPTPTAVRSQESETFSLNLRAPKEETDPQPNNTDQNTESAHIPTKQPDSTNGPNADSIFGTMVLQGLRDLRPMVKKPPVQTIEHVPAPPLPTPAEAKADADQETVSHHYLSDDDLIQL